MSWKRFLKCVSEKPSSDARGARWRPALPSFWVPFPDWSLSMSRTPVSPHLCFHVRGLVKPVDAELQAGSSGGGSSGSPSASWSQFFLRPVLSCRLAPVFSLFVPFYLLIPRMPVTQVLGQIHITNKSLVYVVGLQVSTRRNLQPGFLLPPPLNEREGPFSPSC